MPEPFRFFAVQEFPWLNERPYLVPNQTRIGEYDAADTVIRLAGSITAGERMLERLEIQHDVLVQAGGRAVIRLDDGEARLESFNEYITTYYLGGYLSRSEGLLIIEGSGHVVRSAYRTLHGNADKIGIAGNEIQLDRLTPSLGRIRGAWFSRMSGAVNALGMFGQDVAGSAEWEDAQLNAELRNLMFQHYFEDEIRTLTITKDAGVVVYQTIPSEDQILRLVFDVYDSLVAPALAPVEFSRNRGTARDSGIGA